MTGLSEMDREVMKEEREDEEWSRLVSNDVQERRANDVCKRRPIVGEIKYKGGICFQLFR